MREGLLDAPHMTLPSYRQIVLNVGFDEPFVDDLCKRLAEVWPAAEVRAT